jgi:hypothetical protein
VAAERVKPTRFDKKVHPEGSGGADVRLEITGRFRKKIGEERRSGAAEDFRKILRL